MRDLQQSGVAASLLVQFRISPSSLSSLHLQEEFAGRTIPAVTTEQDTEEANAQTVAKYRGPLKMCHPMASFSKRAAVANAINWWLPHGHRAPLILASPAFKSERTALPYPWKPTNATVTLRW